MSQTVWIDELLDHLSAATQWGYRADGPAATESTALAALALAAHGRARDARRGSDWLARLQADDGSVGVSATQAAPCWPTSLAVHAWNADRDAFARSIDRAVVWLLATKGEQVEETEKKSHNRLLIGWPWIVGTHSWVEPTALAAMALKATGRNLHARTREAMRLLVDRLLPGGGCNYGNTFVLGQELLPHVQPTGVALAALAGEDVRDPRVGRSVDWLAAAISARTATASLSWALLGLAAHGRTPPRADAWLAAAFRRTMARDRSPYRLALVALAALGDRSPLVQLTSNARSP
jgi:hypothetical protein